MSLLVLSVNFCLVLRDARYSGYESTRCFFFHQYDSNNDGAIICGVGLLMMDICGVRLSCLNRLNVLVTDEFSNFKSLE